MMSAKEEKNHTSYVIIGAGPVGLLTALAIRASPHFTESKTTITIYERRLNLEQRLEESYPIGVTPRGLRALRKLCPECTAIEQSGSVVKSWDIYAGSKQVASVPSGTTLGHTRFSVTEALYRQVVQAGNIAVKFGHKLVSLDTVNRKLTFEQEKHNAAVVEVDCSNCIVVAADGAASAMRRLLVQEAEATGNSNYAPTRNKITPWGVYFRVLVMDAIKDGAEVPLDATSHSIYKGTYCALIGSTPEGRRWLVVPSAKKTDDHSDWFFLDTDSPSVKAMDSLRHFIAEKVPPLKDTKRYFSDSEIQSFFSRRTFTGSLVSLAPLHYPHNDEGRPWIVFLGDSAHSVFPATGEGLNSGLDDVLVFHDTVLSQHPLDLSAYTAARQPDVDALSSLAAEILSTTTGPPEVRATNIVTMILTSIARSLWLIGPSEAELRYGPTTMVELLPYREVLRRHVKDTGLARWFAGKIVSVVFAIKSLVGL